MFTLAAYSWYGFQMLPGYVGDSGSCLPFCAPVFVQKVTALKTGHGELEVSYRNPHYAEGVQQFDVRIKVLMRAAGYLLAKLSDDSAEAETRSMMFCKVDFGWLGACCPDLLAAWPPSKYDCTVYDDASAYLDRMYRNGTPYECSGCTAETAPEDDWLSACALRFDGYQYARRNGLPEDSGSVLDWFLRQPDFFRDTPFLMAAMFMLQRGLMKEGIRGKTSQGWRRFRQLFLQLCNQPVPDDFRHGSFYENWENGFRPQVSDGYRVVQRLHEAAIYGSHMY